MRTNIKNKDHSIKNDRLTINKKAFHNRLIQSHIRDIILLILEETDSEALSLFVTNLIKNITKYNQIQKV